MSDCIYLSLTQIRQELLGKKLSAEEVTQACCARIAGTEKKLRSFITLNTEQALEQAKALDKIGPDPQKPLWGIPIALKDNILTKGLRTTAASRALENFTPTRDAFVVDLLKNAGAIVIGKTNMDEFAMGSSTENSAFGPSYNPWDTTRVPGGSSGGSASCVAANQCFAALGTDTGGSIRQPAALSGCVGLKPTYGRISRRGIISYASSLDQVGPMTRSVEDAELILSIIAQNDPLDATSSQREPFFEQTNAKNASLKGLTLGLPQKFLEGDIDTGVANLYRQTILQAKELGAKIVDISLPHALRHAVAAYYTIATAEASSNLARFDGVRYGYRDKHSDNLESLYVNSRTQGFGKETRQRLLLGAHVLSSDNYESHYVKAARIRRLIRQNFMAAFKLCDAILTPTTPTTAWSVGFVDNDPVAACLKDIFTVSTNLAGLPALTVPVGFTNDLPVGLQIIGKPFDERVLFQVGGTIHGQLNILSRPNL